MFHHYTTAPPPNQYPRIMYVAGWQTSTSAECQWVEVSVSSGYHAIDDDASHDPCHTGCTSSDIPSFGTTWGKCGLSEPRRQEDKTLLAQLWPAPSGISGHTPITFQSTSARMDYPSSACYTTACIFSWWYQCLCLLACLDNGHLLQVSCRCGTFDIFPSPINPFVDIFG